MNVKLQRLLRPLLREVAKGTTPTFRMKSAARQGLFLLGKPASVKKTQGRLRRKSEKQSSRASHNQETAKIRAAVMQRSGLYCESCGIPWHTPPLQLDHFLGGSGRRCQNQAVENCWALCPPCHQKRTYNIPDAEYWNGRFKLFCARNHYPILEHIIHAEPAKAGGAP